MPADSPQPIRIPRGIFNERTFTKELPALHYVMGAIFFALAFINNYVDPDGAQHVVDFWVYYRAAILSHLNPANLYNDAYYDYPMPRSADGATHIYEFMNPPTFIPWVYVLGFFSARGAIMLWTGMNLFLTFLLYRNVSKLAQEIPSRSYRAILQSLVFGLYAWSWCIYNGQVSVILAFAISCFLIAWKEERYRKAMFWLALGLSIKPHYFIPVAFFLFGNRQFRLVFTAAAWILLFALLGTAVDGPGLWLAFVKQVIFHGKTNLYYIMVNFRGVLFLYTPRFLAGKAVALCSILFILIALSALYAGHRYYVRKLSFPIEVLCFWFIAAMYFCPWMHQHDFYLLLPLLVCLMPSVLHYNRQLPFLISYSFVLIDFIVPGFSITSNRITMTFGFAVGCFLLHDLRSQRIPHLRPA